MPSTGFRARILIGDADPVHTLGIFEALVNGGYDVVVAETGTDVVAELRQPNHPPVAILDSRLAGMDSTEICKRMRDADRDIYLILSGENPTTAEMVAGLEGGADLYLPKSIATEELLAHVKVGVRIVNRYQALMKSRRNPVED